MNQRNNEKFIVFVVTVASLGLIIENILMGWEFWVPVAVVVGMVAMWVCHLSDRVDYEISKIFYFGVALLLFFYHDIHYSFRC